MSTHDLPTPRRRPRRPLLGRSVSVLSSASALVLAGAASIPAAADTPAGWEKASHVSAFDFLLVLLLIPVGVSAVIALLVFLPSLTKHSGYQPGQSWRGESVWFGGPTRGIDAADEVTPEELESSASGTGGTSGRW